MRQRETKGDRDRQRDRRRETERDRQTEGERDRQRDRRRERDREILRFGLMSQMGAPLLQLWP